MGAIKELKLGYKNQVSKKTVFSPVNHCSYYDALSVFGFRETLCLLFSLEDLIYFKVPYEGYYSGIFYVGRAIGYESSVWPFRIEIGIYRIFYWESVVDD